MHICVVTPDYPSPSRPSYPFVQQICYAFVKNGCTVTVVAPQSIISIILCRQKYMSTIRYDNVDDNYIEIHSPIDLTAYRLPLLGKYINDFSSFFLRHYIRKNIKKPDVYYGHFWRSGQRIYQEAMRTSTPLYIASGESVILMKNDTKKMNVFCNYVKGVICVSTKNMKESIRNGLTVKEKCKIIPNGIDETLFYQRNKAVIRKKFGFDTDCFIVAFVGFFNERKGIMRVSEAIKQLKDNDIKSIFVGRNVDGPSFEPNCPGILYKGSVDHQFIPEYLSCADVFVLPSFHEGCSNAIVEAMACGIPIISSNIDFNFDILDDTNSILIDPSSISDIAKAILLLKNNTQMRNKLSEGALKKASELTISKRAQKIINYISK